MLIRKPRARDQRNYRHGTHTEDASRPTRVAADAVAERLQVCRQQPPQLCRRQARHHDGASENVDKSRKAAVCQDSQHHLQPQSCSDCSWKRICLCRRILA